MRFASYGEYLLMKERKKTMKEEREGRAASVKRRHIKKSQIQEFLCVVPAVTLVILTIYYPLADLVRISFTDWNLLNKNWNYVGLKNWEWFVHNAAGNYFFQDMWVTLKYTMMSLMVSLGLGMSLALLMNRISGGFSVMRALIFLPKYMAMSTGGVLFVWIFNKEFGILNIIIEKLGGSPVGWLTTAGTALISVVILTGWHGLGYNMMIYLSAMMGIPSTYYEAASLDGAGRFQRFRYITLPLLSPTTLFLLVTHFIGSMKIYNAVDVLTGGGPYRSTEVIVYLIYRLAFTDYRVDRAAVVSIIFFLFLLIVTLLTMRWSENKVHYEA